MPNDYTPLTAAKDRTTQPGTPVLEATRWPVLVTQWNGATFTRPVPLIDRRDLEVGDVVYSSHYGECIVLSVRVKPKANTTLLSGKPALHRTVHLGYSRGRSEASAGTIPLLSRHGVHYGAQRSGIAQAR